MSMPKWTKQPENTAVVVIPPPPEPASTQHYINLMANDETGGDARYLAQHAINKGVQFGSAAGMLLGTTFMITRGGGFKALKLWSLVGGGVGGFAGFSHVLTKAGNAQEPIPLDCPGINMRVNALQANKTECMVDKASFYGGLGGLLLSGWPLIGLSRVSGAFVGTAAATIATRGAIRAGQEETVSTIVEKVDEQVTDLHNQGKAYFGIPAEKQTNES